MGTQSDPPPRDGVTSRTSVRSKVAELLALRDSISESAVSLDKFADEDAVREHVLRPALSSSQLVLRPSASVPAFSKPLKSTSTLGGSTTLGGSSTTLNQTRNASDAAIMSSISSRSGNQKKPSPSPSIKRNKVERLIKEHGSPPGIRVTAGGRIVPSDLRLGSPSFPVDNGSANGLNRGSGRIDRAPYDMGRSNNSMNSMNAMPVNHPAANVGYNQYSAFQPSPALMQYFAYPGNLPYSWTPTQPRTYAAPELPQAPPVSLEDLKQALEKIQHEQRELERNMVIQEGVTTPDQRKKMVEEKIRMITEADKIRKEIKRLEGDDDKQNSASTSEPSLSDSKKQVKPAAAQKPSDFVNPSSALGSAPHNPFLYSTPPPGYMPYPPPPPAALPQFMGIAPAFAAYPNQGFNGHDANAFASTDSLPNLEVNKSANGQNERPQKASGHTARKSHALEIKDPRKLPDLGHNKRSALDPTSPAYTPQKQDKLDDRHGESSPMTSPQRSAQLTSNFPWLSNKKADGPSPMRSATSSAHRPSASSINTADFFPHNPHEHSSSNYVNRKTQPVTPEKSKWNQGPWNPDFLSPDPVQALKAPQVSPVNGMTADMNTLTLNRGPDAFAENGRLHVSRNISKEHSDKASMYTRRSSRKHLKESKTPAASTNGTLNFRNKSTGFLMGFSAGLAGQSVMGTEDLDFMQGWAQGLMQAKRSQDDSNTEASDSSEEEDGFHSSTRLPVGFDPKTETPNRQVSTATIKPASGPIERPAPGVFDSFTSDRSIISDMGLKAPTPKKLKAMSGQSAAADASIRDKIDSILMSNTPIKKVSGNEAELQKNDKSENSPSKLTRVFSGSQHSQQKGQRFSLNCLGDQRSQNRNMRLSYDGQYDDDMAELEGAFPTPHSPKGETSATRATPSKFLTGPSETAGAPSSGSPKRFKLSPSKDRPKNLKPEMEDPTTMTPAAKKKWTEGWKKRFHQIKTNEEEEIAAYRAQNPLNG